MPLRRSSAGERTPPAARITLAQKRGERANLGMLYRDRGLYIAGVEKPVLPTIYSRFGKNAPAHCSSLGNAILAFSPETEVNALLARGQLAAFTPTTITSRPALRKELSDFRKRGYATDRAEHLPDRSVSPRRFSTPITAPSARSASVGARSIH